MQTVGYINFVLEKKFNIVDFSSFVELLKAGGKVNICFSII